METESDDSERWEDFFGSTNELAPTLLGIYDALNTSLETKFNSHKPTSTADTNGVTLRNATHQANSAPLIYDISIPTSNNDLVHLSQANGFDDRSFHSSTSSSTQSLPQTLLENRSIRRQRRNVSDASVSPSKHRNNIRLLSPNVQRIITHSDIEPVDTIDIDALQKNDDYEHARRDTSPASTQHFTKRTTTATTVGHSHNHSHNHKSKLSHIPLSKVTGKLTQAGSELVSTFDSSSEYLNALNFENVHEVNGLSFLTQQQQQLDEDKTPTNAIQPFTFDFNSTYPLHQLPESQRKSIKLYEMQQLAATTQLLTTLSLKPTTPELDTENTETVNFGETTKSKRTTEAINSVMVHKSLTRSSSLKCTPTVPESQLLPYSRSLNFEVKQHQHEKQRPELVANAAQQEFVNLEESSRQSTESLDRLTEMKFKYSLKDTQKAMSPLILPEIAKLKHRPLSSSSLCSTTSSSSSGSDNLNLKLNTSYLASVESLADHSEAELADQHAGMSVFERACLEIVDSERNYVKDLSQVITGPVKQLETHFSYLLDWKERACLRVDELQILFSNIEEIYDFSSALLKHLIESGMDPVKIAKCFIDMRERFSVYTKYCTSYPDAISLLTKLLQATHTNALLTSTQKILQHTLPLGSYLLKPVQRILRYHLLLDNLRKHCDVKEVFQAYEIMRQVAREIDQVKRKLEQQSRVKELSGILDGWLGPELTVLGELRLDGLLMDHNKPRKVFLFSTMLIITKPKEDNRLQFKNYIHQNNLMLSEHLPGEPTSFYVIPYDEPRNQIKLTAKNRDQKRVWTQHIKEAMLEKFDNIPNRAKELVYKLGDEEERTPDKNSWKWTKHSTPVTPVYLERRNQYRRSELRNRSKQKRKTITDLSSFENANDMQEDTKEDAGKVSKPLARNNSIDDSMVPILFRLAGAVRHRNSQSEALEKGKKNNEKVCLRHDNNDKNNCTCILTDQRSKERPSSKSSPFNSLKAAKERSKSVPRINLHSNDSDKDCNRTPPEEDKSVAMKPIEIKQYNHKTMPKRVANLKKQRNSNKRDTFKFYMDVSEFDQSDGSTILKITESTENLSEAASVLTADNKNAATEEKSSVPENTEIAEVKLSQAAKSNEKLKKDAQIVLDLLKDSKEYERLYKKTQRKRSVDSSANIETLAKPLAKPSDTPPPLPSISPPLLETETDITTSPVDDIYDEPIYESLLRNVHVPYKFATNFQRSKSVQYTRQEPKQLPPRPESDYVVLKYSIDGTLQQIDGEQLLVKPKLEQLTTTDLCNIAETAPIPSKHNASPTPTLTNTSSTSTLKSDNENPTASLESMLAPTTEATMQINAQDPIYARPKPKNLVKRLLIAGHAHKISSLENISNAFLSRGNRRKSTDNISVPNCRTNKPPERRASDVSEMCRQSILHKQGSEAVGERMAYTDYADPRTLFNSGASLSYMQRDSVFSLTSSNDSMYGQHNRVAKNSSTELSTNFEYEDDVEANLEYNFRDSAVYSDDNDKRGDYELIDDKTNAESVPPQELSAKRRQLAPPQLPPKPPRLKLLAATTPKVIVCPTNSNQTASRSWVLQQIENFNK